MRLNPLTMRGSLERCWLLSYRIPAGEVSVPAPLELMTFGGFAFWNVVVCRVEALRPAGLPRAVGLGYWHVAYRLCVRVRLASGQIREGLYFVRSDCDSALIAAFGNLMTDFKFHVATVDIEESAAAVSGRCGSGENAAHFRLGRLNAPALAAGSPFDSLEQAAAFLKYQPCAFSPCSPRHVNAVNVVRDESRWQTRLLEIQEAHWPFISNSAARPELCFEAQPLAYQWNRGEILPTAL